MATVEASLGAGSGGIEAQGVLDSRLLPDTEFDELWESIFINEKTRARLLSQAVLNFTLRPQLSRSVVPFHGVILLAGPPGTGKTSLARGLASRTAASLSGAGQFRFLEAEPHALSSAALGRSQRAVRDFLGGTVAEATALGPLIVLLDEVETIAADRQKLSLEANPVDVHRASDAVLAQLDFLASQHPNLLFVATSNFVQAIDEAFLSRVDFRVEIPLPERATCRLILRDTVEKMAGGFPRLLDLLDSPELEQAARVCEGLDGRQIRKAVITACTFDKRTALEPERLTGADILAAIEDVKSQQAKESK